MYITIVRDTREENSLGGKIVVAVVVTHISTGGRDSRSTVVVEAEIDTGKTRTDRTRGQAETMDCE